MLKREKMTVGACLVLLSAGAALGASAPMIGATGGGCVGASESPDAQATSCHPSWDPYRAITRDPVIRGVVENTRKKHRAYRCEMQPDSEVQWSCGDGNWCEYVFEATCFLPGYEGSIAMIFHGSVYGGDESREKSTVNLWKIEFQRAMPLEGR